MMIQLEIGPENQKTVRELISTGDAIPGACAEGLEAAAVYAAAHVVANYLTGQALKVRSGLLRENTQGWLVRDTEAIVGVRPKQAVDRYKWLLGDEDKTILPTEGHKFLAIPIGEALAGAGTLKAKYRGGLRNIAGGFFVKTHGRLLFGIKQGKRGKFRPLFTLVTSVLVQGTGALWDGVEESMDKMVDIIQNKVNGKVN